MLTEPVDIVSEGVVNSLIPVDEFIRAGQAIRFPVLREIERLRVRVDYVPYGRWHDAPTTSSVFTHSFPCGTWGDVRVTANGGGGSATSSVHTVFVGGDCGSGGTGGGAFAGDGAGAGAGKTNTTTPALNLGTPMPNPASGTVRFDLTSGPDAVLTVYDALGRMVAQPETEGGTVQIDLAGWPAGVYTARLHSETDATARRFVVTR